MINELSVYQNLVENQRVDEGKKWKNIPDNQLCLFSDNNLCQLFH